MGPCKWIYCLGSCLLQTARLCSALYSLCHDPVTWENRRVLCSSWSLFSSSGCQVKKKIVQSNGLASSKETSMSVILCFGRGQKSWRVKQGSFAVNYSLTENHTKHSTNPSILLDFSLCCFGFFPNSLSKLYEAFMSSKGKLENINQMGEEDKGIWKMPIVPFSDK